MRSGQNWAGMGNLSTFDRENRDKCLEFSEQLVSRKNEFQRDVLRKDPFLPSKLDLQRTLRLLGQALLVTPRELGNRSSRPQLLRGGHQP